MTEDLAHGCAIPGEYLQPIQTGTLSYAYKGVPMLKNPFDIALYLRLLFEVKPRTIVEIGSNAGGSALWFSDTMHAYGIDSAIYSVDIAPPDLVARGVSFLKGDGRRLAETLTTELMSSLQRPMLVFEDADHTAATTLEVLRFFDDWLKPGEYIIVEDGVIDDLYSPEDAAPFAGGPRRAIAEFLNGRSKAYLVDRAYCDYFGRNVTWNVNGFLKKL